MRKISLVGIAGLFLFISACGGSESSSDTTVVEATESVATYPVTVGDLTLDAQPMRIVSLSPSATEMLFAIGAGPQVVAVDDYSNFPAEAVALGTALSGFEPNVEAIAGFTPNLVVIGYDPGGLVDQLTALSIPVFTAPAAATLDDAYAQIEQFGMLTGHVDTAVALSSQMQADIEAAVAQIVMPAEPISFYHELDNTYYSVTSNTFVGQIYSLFGMRNIADNAEAGNDYPQLSAEAIVSANPDIIFLADTKCCEQSAETVTARDGWGGMKAVSTGRIIALDDDVASRWGPRLVELVIAIRDAVTAVLANS
ncbi:MAG: ABC transporter substrate-binding protein [Actinobacteria bacterium]|nr:ABC transporter substrate-binding protein [Actinomycetota bacterium]